MPFPSALLDPVRMGTLLLRNRVVMAPLTRGAAGPTRVPNRSMADYYAQRASAGLIVTEATSVSPDAEGWVDTPGIYTDEMAAGWRAVVSAVHDRGGAIFLQLWHCGRASHSEFRPDGRLPVAPSAVLINGGYAYTPRGRRAYETPRPLSAAHIVRIAEEFMRASARAKEAGFDGVEIHAANGWLIDTFLQTRTNRRTDDYGGSLANRFRFLGQVLDAVGTVWADDRVGVRLSPNGTLNDMGSPDFRETFLGVAERLDGRVLGYLHVIDGVAFGFHGLGSPLTLSDLRRVFRGRLIGNGGYTCDAADAAIAAGHADLVSFGRAYLSNPDLVERFAAGRPLEVVNPNAVGRADDQPTYGCPAGGPPRPASAEPDQPAAGGDGHGL